MITSKITKQKNIQYKGERRALHSASLLAVSFLSACSFEPESNNSNAGHNTQHLINSLSTSSTQKSDYNNANQNYSDNNDLYFIKMGRPLTSQFTLNEAAYIPPQCYTQTEDDSGNLYNTCYTCHIDSTPLNYIDDGALQLELSFQNYALKNRWKNLFIDRSNDIQAITDQEIATYVRSSNYKNANDQLILAEKLRQLPKDWDQDKDGRWSGYVPDAYFNFDHEGFDRNPQGGYTGWRSFAYYPLPGSFMPTNGSTDDVLIRLPKVFQTTALGKFDALIYSINLAIVESLIKQRSIVIPPTDEKLLAVDLNQNQRLDTATHIEFEQSMTRNKKTTYVGAAKIKQAGGEIKMAAGLYPKGTEFLHTVRYIAYNKDDEVILSPRLKELRYAVKKDWYTYYEHQAAVIEELKERDAFPERLKTVYGNLEQGVSNNLGWIYQGFIEDQNGELRPQTFEEQLFCVGCHGTIGRITDSTFALPRKLSQQSAFQFGWYHWSQKSLKGTRDPLRADGETEFAFYLENANSGDEFRNNHEVQSHFFDTDGRTKATALTELRKDISTLLWPSKQRAKDLNKAYKVLVEEQSFIFGRQALTSPAAHLHEEIKPNSTTGIKQAIPMGSIIE